MMKSNKLENFAEEVEMPGKPFYTFLFCILILSLGTSYGNTNVLTNPSFESGTTGWSDRSCSISAVTSPVHSGSYSGRAYNRTQTWQGIKQNVLDKMVIGATYQISGWIRTSSASSNTVKVSIQKTDNGGTSYTNVDVDSANNSGWVYLSGNYTLTVNGTLTELLVYFEGPPAGVDIYVDDAVVFGPEPAPPDPNAIGQVDVNTRHQNIEGFGASGAWYTGTLVNHPQKNTLYDLLFKQLGLDIFRIRNTYEIESDTFNDSVTIAQQGEAALGRPLKIMISSWSPPAYLKSNGSTVGGTLKKSGGNYMYTEFAQWWYNSLAAYAAQGVVADYINIQNEPDWTADWDTCRFDPTENSTNAGYDAAFEAVWQKLNTEMGSAMPKMLASEATGFDLADDYINNLDNLSHVYGYAHHLYNCSDGGEPGCGENPDNYISNMANFNSLYGNKPLFQTEYEYLATTWTNAMNTALLLHNSLTVEEVTSYLYWELFWGSGSGLVSLTSSSYTINPVYYGFKHYSAFIDSGWQRVDASTDSSSLRTSAYISPDNRQLSVVIINTSTDTDIHLDLSFAGFSITSGNIYRSSQTENCILVGGFDGTGLLTLPADSITTLALSGTLILTNCQQVQDLGLNLSADLDGNCRVNYMDLLVLADQWLSTEPVAIPPYYSPDICADGEVNLFDFAIFAIDWANCNDPEDENCLQNW